MVLPSPVAAIPDMTPVISQAQARANSLLQSSWMGLTGMGQPPVQAAQPAAAQAPPGAGQAPADGTITSSLQSWNQPAQGQQGAPTSSADLIAGFEGFRERPYWDVNAHRVGFGSDTITRADGSIVRVTPDMSVSREDALRDLDRRISTEFRPSAVQAIGQDVYGRLNPNQQAVLDSLAYNYGAHAWNKGLAPVAQAIRSGGDVAAAISGLGSHNNGINAKRRAREAALWAGLS